MTPEDRVRNLIYALLADGRVVAEEKRQLFAVAGRLGVPEPRVDELYQAIIQAPSFHPPRPASPAEAELLVDDLIGMILVDRVLSQGEIRHLRRTAYDLGVDDHQLRRLLTLRNLKPHVIEEIMAPEADPLSGRPRRPRPQQ